MQKFIQTSGTWLITQGHLIEARSEKIDALIIEDCPAKSMRLKGQLQLIDELLELPETLIRTGRRDLVE